MEKVLLYILVFLAFVALFVVVAARVIEFIVLLFRLLKMRRK